jgi:hypothetical protein
MKRHIVVAALALIAVVWPALASAQTTGWTRPIELSVRSQVSQLPDIIAGPEGSVHTVWWSHIRLGEQETVGADVLMYRELRNSTWSPANSIANPNRGASQSTIYNALALGRDGRLHALIRNSGSVEYLSAPQQDSWSVHSWSPPQRINGDGAAYYVDLAADSRSGLHALWTELVPEELRGEKCENCHDLIYRHTENGGDSWSVPLNLSQTAGNVVKPQIAVDQGDQIHVVWEEATTGLAGQGIRGGGVYRRSTDGGESWGEPVRFTLARDVPQRVSIGLHNQTSPVVVFSGTRTNALYYQFSGDGGQTWRAPAPIPGVQASILGQSADDAYAMATDGAGNVHLVFVGLLASESIELSQPRLLHLVWNGRAWSQPSVIASNGLLPEQPKIAVGNGNLLHVVWASRAPVTSDQDAAQSQQRVWYAAQQLNIAAVAAPPLFTPTPSIEAAAAPTAVPSTPLPTPLPTAIAGAAMLSAPPSWEGQGLMALVPALLLTTTVVLVLVVGVWRRNH